MGVDPAIRDDGVASTAPVSNTELGWLKKIYNTLVTGAVSWLGSASVLGATSNPDAVAGDVSAAATVNAKLGALVTAAQSLAAVPISGTVSITDVSNGEYETVAASQTGQVMGTTGAIGDWLQRIIIQPATIAPGVVTIIDNATTVLAWPGGTVGADLKPFAIDFAAKSVSGAWKVTTGANVSVVAVGNFT